MNEKNCDRRFHSGPVKGICDGCNNKKGDSPWVHLPHIKILRGKNYTENIEIARKNNILEHCLCWDCYNEYFN